MKRATDSADRSHVISPAVGDRPTSSASDGPCLADRDYRLVADIIYRHAGIKLGDDKRELVRSRLAKRLRAVGMTDFGDYLKRHIQPAFTSANPSPAGEAKHFVDALSTNLTSFFREKSHFDYLRNTFLPSLIADRARHGDRRIRAWCAACSSGEEAYTLAMTLLSSVPDGGRGWDVKLLATDISTRVLATATAGVYPMARCSGIPSNLAGRFFEPRRMTDGSQALAAGRELKSIIRFRHLNLMGDWPFTGPFDFIFCRNVMIYFDKQTQERLVLRFHQMLPAGSLLFTGHSESLTGLRHPYTHVEASIYRK